MSHELKKVWFDGFLEINKHLYKWNIYNIHKK